MINKLNLVFKARKSDLLLLFYSFGVIVFFVIRELIVDKLYSQEFVGPGGEKEKFKLSIFLVFLQAIVNCIFSLLVPCLGSCIFRPKIEEISEKTPNKKSQNKSKSPPPPLPLSGATPPIPRPGTFRMICEFSIPAIAQLIAGYLGNKSMEFVDNSTKTIAKSCKPVPIMLFGMIFRGKRYHILRYLAIFSVTAGISLFMLELQKEKEGNITEIANSWLGFGLTVLALVMDAVVANSQDLVKERYNPSATTLMFSTNIWATVLSAVSLFISGESSQVIQFIKNNPGVLYELLFFSIATPIGNHFIFLLIHEFGSLKCSIVTTVRKFLTILVNTFWLGRNVTPWQWVSVVVVFGGLELDRHGTDLEKKAEKDKQKQE